MAAQPLIPGLPSANFDPRSSRLTKRVIGFIDHLRLNHFVVGPAETEALLSILDDEPQQVGRVRAEMKTLLTSRKDEWNRFDDLFEAYWTPNGRERSRKRSNADSQSRSTPRLPKAWKDHLGDGPGIQLTHAPQIESEDERDAEGQASGRLVATDRDMQFRTDFRQLADPSEIAEAEDLALRLARAIRNRLSRRVKASHHGQAVDLRRTVRASLGHGGEPIDIVRRRRPQRPVRITVFLDVSGSMKHYSRFFLQFVKGLVSAWVDADAYLIHTRLVRITEALRDKDAARAMSSLSLMANGYGGGTKLGQSLRTFNDSYAKRSLNSRTVILILSDGYDTGPADYLAAELARMRKRARRIIWLNPLLGWENYEPVTAAMNAARPHIDHFAAANTPASMAAIEPHLSSL